MDKIRHKNEQEKDGGKRERRQDEGKHKSESDYTAPHIIMSLSRVYTQTHIDAFSCVR